MINPDFAKSASMMDGLYKRLEWYTYRVFGGKRIDRQLKKFNKMPVFFLSQDQYDRATRNKKLFLDGEIYLPGRNFFIAEPYAASGILACDKEMQEFFRALNLNMNIDNSYWGIVFCELSDTQLFGIQVLSFPEKDQKNWHCKSILVEAFSFKKEEKEPYARSLFNSGDFDRDALGNIKHLFSASCVNAVRCGQWICSGEHFVLRRSGKNRVSYGLNRVSTIDKHFLYDGDIPICRKNGCIVLDKKKIGDRVYIKRMMSSKNPTIEISGKRYDIMMCSNWCSAKGVEDE